MVIDNDRPSSGLEELIDFGSSRKVVVSIETDVDWIIIIIIRKSRKRKKWLWVPYKWRERERDQQKDTVLIRQHSLLDDTTTRTKGPLIDEFQEPFQLSDQTVEETPDKACSLTSAFLPSFHPSNELQNLYHSDNQGPQA